MPFTRSSSAQAANGALGSQDPASNTTRPDRPDDGIVAILQHIAHQGDTLNQDLAKQTQQLENLQTQPRIEERPTVAHMNPQIFDKPPSYDAKDFTKFRPW
ncbi:hypothetical protein E4U13_007489 [Claviceps humidiphila]|uniref:Uncharacterized protein n=1 Tax=Claviceps humidiphila TaxID=1294629 RepID=A0A9P7TWH4_9HYPO|nr:hypothetical protein E4U13_007489 [Claviceps humidiphila]